MRKTRWARAGAVLATALVSLLLAPAAATANSAVSPEDIEEKCNQNLQAAGQRLGYAISRYEWCRKGRFDTALRNIRTQEIEAVVGGVATIFGYAAPDSRSARFTIALRDVVIQPGTENPDDGETFITVTNSCQAPANISCDGALRTERSVEDWKEQDNVAETVTVVSLDNTGFEPYFTNPGRLMTEMLFEIRDGETASGEATYAETNIRFDSAGTALSRAPFHGTVFPDNIPKLELSTAASSPYREEALHVRDALQNPTRTFPSILGKAVPSRLNRYMGSVNNNDEARKVCIDVWGPNYAGPPGMPPNDPNRRECDEYPFSSTYQGARLSTTTHEEPNGNWRKWRGSARPIHWSQNNQGGQALNNFYGAHRILDGDTFDVGVTP